MKNNYKNNFKNNPKNESSTHETNENFMLEGRNPIKEALSAGKTIHRLLVTNREADGSLKVIIAMAKEQGVQIVPAAKEKLDNLSETGRHQGIIALCPAYEYADLDDVLANIATKDEQPFLIILDKIYDPHNLGAIIRTACAAGAHAVIIPKRRSAGITAAVVRASAGAVEHLPVCRVSNISQTIDHLKKQNIWICGTSADGQNLYDAPLTGALAIVIGNEGEGMSRLVSEKCDFLIGIPMYGPIGSLNASVAAAVTIYEVIRRGR